MKLSETLKVDVGAGFHARPKSIAIIGEKGKTETANMIKKILSMENIDYEITEISLDDKNVSTNYDIGIFTNLSKERKDKVEFIAKVLSLCKVSVINIDDIYGAKIKKLESNLDIHTYGIDNMADLTAKDITVTPEKVDFKVKIAERNERVKVGVGGRFNVYNALAAIWTAKKLGASGDNIKQSLENLQ